MSDLSQVVRLPVRRIELDLSFEGAARIAEDLRDHVPGIAAEAVRRIEQRLPEFVRPHDPRYAKAMVLGVECAIGHFLELMADPGAPSAEVVEFWRQIGVGEASEGRTLDAWQAATRIGTGLAVEQLTECAERLGHRTSPANIAAIANAALDYLNQVAAIVAEGHADAAARAAGRARSTAGGCWSCCWARRPRRSCGVRRGRRTGRCPARSPPSRCASTGPTRGIRRCRRTSCWACTWRSRA